MDSGCVKIGRCGDAAPIDEREVMRQHLHRSSDAATAHAAQFDKIVTRGKGDEEAPFVAQDTPEFTRVRPPRDRHYDRERTIGIRHEAIRVGYDPFASGVAPRRQINGPNRDVNSMSVEAGRASKSSKVEAITASGIEDAAAAARP